LIAATEALQDRQEELDRLEDKLKELEHSAAGQSDRLDASRRRLAQLAEALTRLSLRPPESFLFRDAPVEDHVRRAVLLRALLPRLKDETDRLAQDLGDLEESRKNLAEQRRLSAAARQNLARQRSGLDQLTQTRQGLLQKTAAEKAALAQRLAELANEAKDLKQLMEKVSHPVVPRGPQRLRAGLKLPTAGKIVRAFGTRDEAGVTSHGLTLAAAPESPVVAPQDGRVAFAGPFRGYGRIIILQHDGGYHSFLAGLDRIDIEAGQKVAAGEPLGALPGKGESRPELYFEWRRGGEPVDPMIHGVAQRAGKR
jgi:septal ring factor EnvC (AmiA/AmiB activator)